MLTKVALEGAWLSFYVFYIAGCLEVFSYARYPIPSRKSFDDYDTQIDYHPWPLPKQKTVAAAFATRFGLAVVLLQWQRVSLILSSSVSPHFG